MTSEPYNINIIGRSVLVTEAMKRYAREKLAKIDKFHSHPMHIHVTMDIEHLEHKVAVIAKFDHFEVKAQGLSTDMYASIDIAVDRLQSQLRKWKDKIQDHGRKEGLSVDLDVLFFANPYPSEVAAYNAEIEEANKADEQKRFKVPHMTKCKSIPLKALTADEAMMKLDLSGDRFLLYRSEEDRKLKVMYRRNDGNYGIIQPE